jgi:hypothetical protein
MNRQSFVAALLAAVSLVGAPVGARESCAPSGRQLRAAPRLSFVVMQPPALGATQRLAGAQAASPHLVLAHQDIVIAPRIRYLAAPVSLIAADGSDMAASVPLGRGAPITTWRDVDGEKQCAIGWRNGLFGGVTGDGHMRWVCLEDRDHDGAYDNAWRTVTRSMGLSYSRLDMPIAPPVAGLETPPAEAAATGNVRARIQVRNLARSIEVDRADASRLVLDVMLAQEGRSERVERREIVLAGPTTITIAGVSITVTPNPGAAPTLAVDGDFNSEGIALQCDGTRVRVGELTLMTSFGFGNW